MSGSIKSTARDTAIYGFGNIAVKIVGLILVPLYTNTDFFTENDFGVIGMLEVSGLAIVSVLSFSIPMGFSRWYWEKDMVSKQKGIYFMTLVGQVITVAALCGILIPFSDDLARGILGSSDWGGVFSLLIISSGLQTINNLTGTLMRLQSRSRLFTVTNILKLLVVLSLTLLFIIEFRLGITGIYLAQVAGNAFFILVLLPYTIKNSTPFFDKVIFSEMNAYGFPLWLGAMAAVMLNVVDRFSLNSMSVLKSVAIYTLAFKVTSALKLVIVDSIKLSILPVFFKKMDQKDNKRFYAKVLLYTSWALMASIVCISTFSYEAVSIISTSDTYLDAIKIIPILALALFFTNLKEITVYGLHISRKSSIISLIVIGSTIAGLALNILLIPVWDYKGAAIATLLSQFIYFAASYFFAQRAFFIPYDVRKIIMIFLVGTLLCFAGIFLNEIALVPRIGIKLFIVLLFPFSLYFLGFYEPEETEAIKGLVKKWSNLKMLKQNIASLKDYKEDE